MNGSGRAALLAALGLALGAASATADEDLYFSSLPVVATVSRLPQAQADAPGSVTVIDRDMIRASGVRNISDLLRLVPGFQVAPTNTDNPRVTYHGLSDSDFSVRVQVLVDGRSLYSPLFLGGVNWNLMPVALEDIERVEVLRGTNSAAYGSNAFLGVVNIITLDPAQARGASASVSQGNQGLRDATARWGGKLGPGSFRLTYQERDDDGIANRNDWIDNFRSRLVDFRADFSLTERDELQLEAGHVASRIQNGRIGNPCDPLRGFDQTSSFAQAGWRRTLADSGELSLRFAHTEDWASDRHTELCDGFLIDVDYGGRGTRDDLELQHIVQPAMDLRLVWGLGARHDTVRGPIWFAGDRRPRRTVARAFGNLEWRPSAAWILNLGGMWERDSLTRPTFSPRLSASVHLSPEHTVRFGATRSYRTPSIVDVRGDSSVAPYYANPDNGLVPAGPVPAGSFLYRVATGNAGLEPEKLTSLEIGYLAELRAWRMSLDARVYREHIANRILKLPIGHPCQLYVSGICIADDVDYAANAQRNTVYGIEYQWRWQPVDDTRLMVNQALIHIDPTLLDTDTTAGDQIKERIQRHTEASAPRLATTFMLMQRLPLGLEFSGTYHYVGEMQWTRNTAREVPTYRRLDLRLGYPFRSGDFRGELAYVVQNANGKHAEYKFDRIFSERHWLTLRLDL